MLALAVAFAVSPAGGQDAAVPAGAGLPANETPDGAQDASVAAFDTAIDPQVGTWSQTAPPRELVRTLRQLGMDYEITLRGVEGSAGATFGTRSDEVATAASLRLRYSYSPALLPDMSHLRVSVNGVVVATLPTPSDGAGQVQETDIAIDPRVLVAYNQLDLRLIGHYTRECEDPDHTSLWANIDRDSALTIVSQPLALADELALLPAPFFDERDSRKLELPIVFPAAPDTSRLQTAGVVASWFGALAGYRGADFPAYVGRLPDSGNAVVLTTPERMSALLANSGLEAVQGPTIAVLTHPADPYGKVLVITGRDDEELRQAALALALDTPLQGASVTIDSVDEPMRRAPHDAPNWLSSAHPVRLDSLVANERDLSVTGYRPDLIRINLRLPPDLFAWRQAGIPVDLRYRYTVPQTRDSSAMNVTLNDVFVQTLPLDGRPLARNVVEEALGRFRPQAGMPVNQPVRLPLGPLSAQSQLRFHFAFDRPALEECRATFPDVSASIDADSTIDISRFHHFMAMPNLAAFANAGFPFTRVADLAETTVVLPDRRTTADLSVVLTLLGRLGASTGYPTFHVRLAGAGEREALVDRDLILLGSQQSQPLLREWSEHLPISGDGDSRSLRISDWVRGRMPAFLSPGAARTDLPTLSQVTLRPVPGDTMLMGFESPLSRGRSVVALVGDAPGDVQRYFDALLEPDRLRVIQGSLALLQQDRVISVDGNQSYHVGSLPPLTWLRWVLSRNPLPFALGIVLLAVLIGLAARLLLRRHSAERLYEGRQR